MHRPVLLEQTVAVLAPHPGDSYLDFTAGYGGHARVVLKAIGDASHATLIDRDDNAIAHLAEFQAAGATLIRRDFASAAEELTAQGKQFDMILLDLGVSSPHLDQAARGFSFRQPGPLDMRMDQSQASMAADIVNTYTEDRLAYIIREFGEEPKARAIAHAIVTQRPHNTTTELAQTIASAIRGKWGKTHPATRTFQAIRIVLNDELGQLERTLQLLPRLLASGGRVAIISFHSLEDRMVKSFFKEQADAGFEASLRLLTKKPISGATYDVHNPRARSAMLRAAVKL